MKVCEQCEKGANQHCPFCHGKWVIEMSLREEIFETIKEYKLNKNPNLEWYVGHIITLFEKRIDEMKDKALRKEGIIKVSDKENTKFQIGYAKGVLIMRVSIKEMLK